MPRGVYKRKPKPIPKIKPKKIDLAWAAGIFDGEGWSTVNRTYLQLGVAQKDRRLLDRFQNIFQAGKVFKPGGTSPCFTWRCSVSSHVKWVMSLLWLYLSDPKKEQYLRCEEVIKKNSEYSKHPQKG